MTHLENNVVSMERIEQYSNNPTEVRILSHYWYDKMEIDLLPRFAFHQKHFLSYTALHITRVKVSMEISYKYFNELSQVS